MSELSPELEQLIRDDDAQYTDVTNLALERRLLLKEIDSLREQLAFQRSIAYAADRLADAADRYSKQVTAELERIKNSIHDPSDYS